MTEGEHTWQAERLYVLRAIEDLKAEQKDMALAAAADRAAVLDKATKDIDQAHGKIRKLESEHSLLRFKNWAMAAVLSGIGFVLIEWAKSFVVKWKP